MCGWSIDGVELRARAAAIVEAKKRFNVREGWTPADDTLPARFLSTATEGGPTLTRERLQAMILAYNRARGWSDDGYPPAAP